MTLVLSNKQRVSLSVEFKDKDGVITPVFGVPTWASSNTAILTVTPSADGLSAEATTVDNANGSSQVTVNLGGLSAVLDVDVNDSGSVGAATSAEIKFGVPSNK